MWIFNFKKSPQELLEEKYLELIDTNGVDLLQINPPWFHFSDKTYFSWNIRWVKWVGILVYRAEFEIPCYGPNQYTMDYEVEYSYGWSVWKIDGSSEFAEKVWAKMNRLYMEEQTKVKEEHARLQEKLEEEKRLKQDQLFIEEYNRLSGSTWEFNKQFKLLKEIDELWKKQVELLRKWEENKNLIYSKREEFYSL